LFDQAELIRYTLFLESSYEPLAHLAKKIKGELKYHTMHAETFLFQLANGNEVSKARMQSALNECFPYALGVFETFEGEQELINEGIYPGEQILKAKWLALITEMIAEAGLKMPEIHAASSVEGGRNGYHSDFLLPLLTEMREVIAIDPNAEW
jgi:ring-1,2-phenylacetyl-CoA epoxidase subunit PaaC